MKYLIAILSMVSMLAAARAQTNGMSAADCLKTVNEIMLREAGTGGVPASRQLLEQDRAELEGILPLAPDPKSCSTINAAIAANYARRGDMEGAWKTVELIPETGTKERTKVDVYYCAKGFQAGLRQLEALMEDKEVTPQRRLLAVIRFKTISRQEEGEESAALMRMSAKVLPEAKVDDNAPHMRQSVKLFDYCKKGYSDGLLEPEKYKAMLDALAVQPSQLGGMARKELSESKSAKGAR